MFIGIDLGTTTVKASCFDETGKLVCVKKRQNIIYVPQAGWAELDPYSLWKNVCDLLCEITKCVKEKILAVSFSSQGEGVVPLDAHFIPVGNIILSYDRRAKKETQSLRNRISDEQIYEITGQIVSSVHTAPKIAWILNNQQRYKTPPVFFACVSDYIISCFGLPPSSDYSLAARTMMFDVQKLAWSDEILKILGITKTQLPQVFKAGTLLGKPDKKICKQTGLPEDVCIVQGGHDQACSEYGCAVLGEGEAAYSLGTTETLICETSSFMPELRNIGLPSYPHIANGKFITLPGNFTGGNIIQWFCSQFAQNKSYQSVVAEMAQEPTKLLVLPHFTSTGSPYNDDSSAGAVIGLNIHTTKNEFFRALVEGVTYEILLNIRLLGKKGIKIMKLIAMGGVSQSGTIMQLKSDVFGLPIEVCPVQETACRGAAMLAASALDIHFVELFFEHIKNEKRLSFIPKKEYTSVYAKNFNAYKKLYKAVKHIIS